MKNSLKRLTALALLLVLTVGMAPAAFAAETAGTENDPTAPTEPTTYTQEDEPQVQPPSGDGPSADTEDGIMPLADTITGITLFDLASPNYTVTLSSQLTVKYKPYGASSSVTAYIKNLGWHFPRINNVSYENRTLFCIEPHKNYAASTPGASCDDGMTLDGSGSSRGATTWYSLPRTCRESIMLTLLYCQRRWDDSYNVKTTAPANNPNVPLRVATQFLIYELVCGLRDPDTYQRNADNGYTSGDIFYNAGAKISGFADHYNAIVSSVQSAMTIPSFAGKTASSAPTITMDEDEISVLDTNGVLGNFSIQDGNGASFDKSGNRLYITKTGNISPSTVYTLSRSLPSADSSKVSIFYPASTTYQTCVCLSTASNGELKGYFKLDPPASTGTLNINKTTSDGKNLGGWQFAIYADPNCTNRVSGPHTSSASGRISVGNLNAGTYYVKELGNSNSSINASYTCTSPNPQRVVISSGQTASVSFVNALDPGSLALTKTTSDGKNLGGWLFSIFSDQGCTSRISGPHATDANGKLTVPELAPGTVYVKEMGHQDSAVNSQYTCSTANPQKVTITAGQTASVAFMNVLKSGSLALTKTTEDGKHLDGWQFSIYADQGCTSLISGPHTTDANGKLTVPELAPGTVYVKEMGHQDSTVNSQYTCATANPQKVTITAGQTTSVSFHNKLNTGNVKLFKQTNTGTDRGGWRIGVFTDPGCKNPLPGSPFVTEEDGSFTIPDLKPGTYYAREEASSDPAWECDTEVKTITILPGRTSTVIFKNTLKFGSVKLIKETNTGADRGGWRIGLYTDQDCKAPISGSPFTTGEDGTFTLSDLRPGVYYAKEEASSDPLWECDTEVKQVTVVADQMASVKFTNKQRLGQLIIHKANQEGSSLAGAGFLLEWSEDGKGWQPVIYSETPTKGGCASPGLKDGKLVSGEDGLVVFQGLHPALKYRLTETNAPSGHQLLTDYAFEGNLPTEQNYTMEVTIVNMPNFTLPKTGSKSRIVTIISLLTCLAGLGGAILYLRKRRW